MLRHCLVLHVAPLRSLASHGFLRCGLAVLAAFCLASLPTSGLADSRRVLLISLESQALGAGHRQDMDDAVRNELRRRDVEALSESDVSQHMHQLGVDSLASRAEALKVAKAAEASALLRYEGKGNGESIELRMAVYWVDSGKAVLVEKTATGETLAGTLGAMIEELFGTPSRTEDGDDGQGKASQASGPRFSFGRFELGSAFVARLQIGASVPLGGGSDLVGTGFRVASIVGYEIQLGESVHSLTPELTLAYSNWGLADDVGLIIAGQGILLDGSVGIVTVLAGARYTAYLGPVALWLAPHLGYGRGKLSASARGTEVSDSESKGGFAFNFDFGAAYMFLRYVGAGLFFDITKVFVDKIEDTEIPALGLAVGLNVTGRLPM